MVKLHELLSQIFIAYLFSSLITHVTNIYIELAAYHPFPFL